MIKNYLSLYRKIKILKELFFIKVIDIFFTGPWPYICATANLQHFI
jgi:hypothetical protein